MTSRRHTTLSLLLDENVDRRVGPLVHDEGHDAEHVVDVLEPGVDDATDIAPYARTSDRIVVTKDTDFLRMEPSRHAGVFFVSNHGLDAFEIARAIVRVGDSGLSRDDLRDVTFLDAWR